MATLPRLSSDGRQIKTYAKQAAKGNGPGAEKESFAISKKAYGYLKMKDVCLVIDLENNHICFVDKEKDLPEGVEPAAKKFTTMKMGKPFTGFIDKNHLKNGNLFLKPYTILFSQNATKALGENTLEFKLGVKKKKSKTPGKENEVSDVRTLGSTHRIWVLCHKKTDKFDTVEEALPDGFAKLDDVEQKIFKNYIVVDTNDENQLMKFKDVDFYDYCIDIAKKQGAKEQGEE